MKALFYSNFHHITSSRCKSLTSQYRLNSILCNARFNSELINQLMFGPVHCILLTLTSQLANIG